MSGSRSFGGNRGDNNRNVRGRFNHVPPIAPVPQPPVVPVVAPPEPPPPAAGAPPELNLFPLAPAQADPAPEAQELQGGDPAVVGANVFDDLPHQELVPHPPPVAVPPQVVFDDLPHQELVPHPPPPPVAVPPQVVPEVFVDILGFPEFPLNDNQGYRHLFRKKLSQYNITGELNITGPNLLSFCADIRNNNLLDIHNKCMVHVSVLLGGGVIGEDLASLRVGNTFQTAHLAWQAVLGQHVVELVVRQPVVAWFRRMDPYHPLHIVIQVLPVG